MGRAVVLYHGDSHVTLSGGRGLAYHQAGLGAFGITWIVHHPDRHLKIASIRALVEQEGLAVGPFPYVIPRPLDVQRTVFRDAGGCRALARTDPG